MEMLTDKLLDCGVKRCIIYRFVYIFFFFPLSLEYLNWSDWTQYHFRWYGNVTGSDSKAVQQYMLQKHETVVSPSGDKANTSPGHYGYQKNQSFYGHNVEILWYFTGTCIKQLILVLIIENFIQQ